MNSCALHKMIIKFKELRGLIIIAILITAFVAAAPHAHAVITTVDFDGVNASGGSVTGAALDAYLLGFGITITNVSPGGSSVQIIDEANDVRINAVSVPNFLIHFPSNNPISYEMNFATPLDGFSFTRAGQDGTGSTGLIVATWSARALDISSTTIDTVGEPQRGFFGLDPPVSFTLNGPGITTVVFERTSTNTNAGLQAVPVDDLVLTSNLEIVPLDIKPQSCPNPVNIKSRGVLPVALLGTINFDVSEVDLVSVRLEGVAPVRSGIEDVARPFDRFDNVVEANDCTEEGPDVLDDLTLKFKTQEVVAALGAVSDGQVLILTLTGNLKAAFGGTPIQGQDVVIIKKK